MALTFPTHSQSVADVETQYRRIRGEIPAPGTEEILNRLSEVESRSMQGQMPLVWDRAEGASVYDVRGNKWIDFTSTIFVANVGHANPRVLEHVNEVLRVPLISTYAFANNYRLEYLEDLIKFAGDPFRKAFLLSAGTEATEATLKLMRLWGLRNGNKVGVLTLGGNWHGRTMGAQAMSSNGKQSTWIIGQQLQLFRMAFPYPWEVNEENGAEFFGQEVDRLARQGVDLRKDVCGFLLETFQGWGALFYPTSFVQALAAFCRENGILLAFDEMQAGFGRTGKNFGFEHYGVTPDLFACGKGMGGGFPLSGVIGTAEVMDLPQVGEMSSTHSANPISCAAGLGVIESLTSDRLVNLAAVNGKLLHEGLSKIAAEFPEALRFISGRGLIAAMIFNDSIAGRSGSDVASQVAYESMRRGVLVVHTGRESIKLGPPLVVEPGALLEGLQVIKNCLASVLKK